MRNIDENTITAAVLESLAGTKDPRLLEVLTALVRHLHDFAREVRLTEAEWMAGIEFLTATGQKCDDKRQEFILLSDTLGLSTLNVAWSTSGRPTRRASTTCSDRAWPAHRARRPAHVHFMIAAPAFHRLRFDFLLEPADSAAQARA
jgi:hypothetical protein